MGPLLTKLLNLGLYQAGWFCCVLGAAWGYPILGGGTALLLLGGHLLLTRARAAELKLMVIACGLGVVVDSLQQALGIFTFKADPIWPLWLPLWVFVIWAQFATLFRYALFWLSRRYLLAATFGMIGGPLAYWAGIRLGAATLGPDPLFSFASLMLVWGLVTPLLFWVSGRLDPAEGRYRCFDNE